MTEPGRRIRVVIVDDHAQVRSGLAAFLYVYDDLEFVGEASSGLEAIEMCGRLQPDVVLIDLVMPDMSGPIAVRGIREASPGVQIVALTGLFEEESARRALRAGAISFLLKNISADTLAQAIRGAAAGQATLAPEVAEASWDATSVL